MILGLLSLPTIEKRHILYSVLALNNSVGLMCIQNKVLLLILTLWCDFGPPITFHHREEAHVVLRVGPELLRGYDLHQNLSFAPHTDPVV